MKLSSAKIRQAAASTSAQLKLSEATVRGNVEARMQDIERDIMGFPEDEVLKISKLSLA